MRPAFVPVGRAPEASNFRLHPGLEIDARELGGLCASLGRGLTAEELAQALGVLDKDGGGEVSFDEFSKWWAMGLSVVVPQRCRNGRAWCGRRRSFSPALLRAANAIGALWVGSGTDAP